MNAVPVVAVLVAKQGSEDAVRLALTALVEPTRQEEGCLAYERHESVTSPGTFITLESWSAAADLNAHLATAHVAAALAAAAAHLADPPAVHRLAAVPTQT